MGDANKQNGGYKYSVCMEGECSTGIIIADCAENAFALTLSMISLIDL